MSHPLEHIFNILSSSNFLFTHKNYLQQAFSLSAEVRSHVFHHIFSFNQFIKIREESLETFVCCKRIEGELHSH